MHRRKKLEAVLAAHEPEFRSLADDSSENIVRYDRQCRTIYCNTVMTQTLAVDPEMILGKTPLELGAGGSGM